MLDLADGAAIARTKFLYRFEVLLPKVEFVFNSYLELLWLVFAITPACLWRWFGRCV
jgi:hypothetical protein